MPRPRLLTPTVRRSLLLPIDLSAILETLFHDPFKEKARYSAINTYIIGLIREDLRKRNLIS
jgi:hypothetical protein